MAPTETRRIPRPGIALLLLAQSLSAVFWPQEIENIKKKISLQPAVSPLNTYELGLLAGSGSCESVGLLLQVADSWDEGTQVNAMQVYLDARSSSWAAPEDCSATLTPEKILQKWTGSASSYLKRTACQMIARGGLTALKEDIGPLLSDPDYDVRLECTRTFFTLHAGADDMSLVVEKFPNILSSGYNEIKMTALKSLGELKIKEAFPAVLTLIGSDNATLRSVALIAAASIDPDKAFPYVSSAIHDENFQVRLSAVSALGRIKTAASVAKLKTLTSDSAVRAQALKEISTICIPESADILLGFLGDSTLMQWAIQGLTDCAGSFPEKLGEALTAAQSPSAVSGLLRVMKANPSPAYLEALLAARPKTAGQEADYLQCLGDQEARKALITILSFTEDKKDTIRLEALRQADRRFDAGGYDPLSTDILINSLSDASMDVRNQAIAMTGKWHVKEAAPFLSPLLSSPDPRLAASAASALLSLGEPAAIDTLVDSLNALDSRVRLIAVEAFMPGSTVCSDGLLDATVRHPASYNPSTIGHRERFAAAGGILKSCRDPKGLETLGALLEDDDDEVAVLAAVAALLSSDASLLKSLGDLVPSSDPDRLREISTYLWLAEGDGAGPLFKAFLASSDAYVRAGAALSLASSHAVGDKKKAAVFLSLLEDGHPGVRVNAMAGLRGLPDLAKASGDKICKCLDRPLTLHETLAALALVSTAKAACTGEKLERLVSSRDAVLKKSAMKAALTMYADDKGAMSETLRYGLSACVLNEPDKENKQVCTALTGMQSDASAYGGVLKAPISILPAATAITLPLKLAAASLTVAGSLTASKATLPREYALKQLEIYPAFYPFFFMNDEGTLRFLFKGGRYFSGIDFENEEIIRYFDALKH